MTAGLYETGQSPPVATVDLQAGVWAALLALVVAAILAVALAPLFRRPEESPMPCSEPDRLGEHPLGPPDEAGVRRCDCGTVTSIPAGGSATVDGVTVSVGAGHVGTPMTVRPRLEMVPRTDTAEHYWPAAEAAFERAVAAAHPTVWQPDAPTEERFLPHLVWPPR